MPGPERANVGETPEDLDSLGTAMANNEKDEEWGLKMGEVPDTEILLLSRIQELLDWGPEGPERAKEHFFQIAEQNIDAFGFGSHLSHNPTKAHICTKEDQALSSQPMYHTSPAKQEVIDQQLKMWFEQGIIEQSKSPRAMPVVTMY
ncbi:hypothetical protein FRB95_001421 [Tulasnella sp. JGI-2019a]|nr:hypothetical protein FRB95_001421 [Tulasnella sp. JGI-2019a]